MPKVTRQQKKLNRERILTVAGKSIRACGIDGVGVSELSKSAGMTPGGLYSHFTSKADLLREILKRGFTESLNTVATVTDAHPRSTRVALHTIIDSYLSTEHRDHPERACVSASLAVDASRNGVPAQQEYRHGAQGYIDAFTDLLRVGAAQRGEQLDVRRAREQAIAMFSQMVGAQVVARAVAQADVEFADEILSATGKALKRQ